MIVELSFIHWDVLDEDDRPVLPTEYKLNIVFFGGIAKQSIAFKGHIIAKELSIAFDRKTRESVYPRDFLWKSSKGDRMHKWSYNMAADCQSLLIARYNVPEQLLCSS